MRGTVSGGGRTNREHFGATTAVDPGLDPDLVDVLFDPQTSGGLLIALAPEVSSQARVLLAAAGCLAADVGRAVPKGPDHVVIG